MIKLEAKMNWLTVTTNTFFILWLIFQSVTNYQERAGWQLAASVFLLVGTALIVGVWVGSYGK